MCCLNDETVFAPGSAAFAGITDDEGSVAEGSQGEKSGKLRHDAVGACCVGLIVDGA